MKTKSPTKLLTIKQRNHLKEVGVRCTSKDVSENVRRIKEANPDKTVGQVCRVCSEIAHRLGVAV